MVLYLAFGLNYLKNIYLVEFRKAGLKLRKVAPNT
jgi:hypothetical protein